MRFVGTLYMERCPRGWSPVGRLARRHPGFSRLIALRTADSEPRRRRRVRSGRDARWIAHRGYSRTRQHHRCHRTVYTSSSRDRLLTRYVITRYVPSFYKVALSITTCLDRIIIAYCTECILFEISLSLIHCIYLISYRTCASPLVNFKLIILYNN